MNKNFKMFNRGFEYFDMLVSIPRKVGVGLKRRRELNKKRWGWRLAW